MRRKFTTIWWLLLLLPYLCCAVMGEIPHVHVYEYGHAVLLFQAHHVVATAAIPSTQSSLEINDSDDDCPLCHMNAVMAAGAICTALETKLPLVVLPPIVNTQSPCISFVLPHHDSRAPPVIETA